MTSTSSHETIHISFGNTANYISSHLLNLEGLSATSSKVASDEVISSINDESCSNPAASLCDPSVTHDIVGNATSSVSNDHFYVPRALIVDGRSSFGPSWGHSGGGAAAPSVDSWKGPLSVWDVNSSVIGDLDVSSDSQEMMQQYQQHSQQQCQQQKDPLEIFHQCASMVGMSPLHSRYGATPPSHSRYSSYSCGMNSSSGSNHNPNDRHVQWGDYGEEDEEDDEDYYGQNEHLQEERRRQLERTGYQTKQQLKSWNEQMEAAWKNAFYGDDHSTSIQEADSSATGNATGNVPLRMIHWHDYWMPPHPPQANYQVPLPFDTLNTHSSPRSNNNAAAVAWSTSFAMGYQPTSSSIGGEASNNYVGISPHWREEILSESLRKLLEKCDTVKGFNVFVDGGDFDTANDGILNSNGANTGNQRSKIHQGGKKSKSHNSAYPSTSAGAGGFYAGLATSLLQELQDECRSAGRWTILVDPFSFNSNCTSSGSGTATHGNNTTTSIGDSATSQAKSQNQFRRNLNSGMALHGLSSNSDAFLPVSIPCAHRALRGSNPHCHPNRILFEGSAAISLALETTTLLYRLRGCHHSNQQRSRIGIQSGFYQGSHDSGNYRDDANEPYPTVPVLTYHEFLACARPSSDRRRSILELDALLQPLSSGPSAATVDRLGGGLPLLPLSSALLLRSSPGISIGGMGNNNDHLGELHRRILMGTSIERMRLEQDRQRRANSFRSSRFRAVSSQLPHVERGDWLEDSSFSSDAGGGIISSLSGNHPPFGRRSDHHHFALSTSLRPSASGRSPGSRSPTAGSSTVITYLRPMMESMSARFRPELCLGLVVKDSVVDLTGVGSYWPTVFSGSHTKKTKAQSEGGAQAGIQTQSSQQRQLSQQSQHQQQQQGFMSPQHIASQTPILSVLGNSSRSYPRLQSISSGFVDALHSRRNGGFQVRDTLSGLVPERDDCEEALEYCREVTDVYEPPRGSGLMEDDENDDVDAYFDEEEI